MNITNVTGSDIPEWLTVQQVVFSGIIVLVGIPGNILIILTFAYSPGKSSTDYMVFSMGISDLLGSAVCAPFNLLRHIPVVWASLGSKWFCRTYDFFAVLTGIISSWILGLVAFDRYMKTCRPFSDVLTTPRTKLLCVSMYILVTILTVPSFGIERFDYKTGACFIIDYESIWSIVLYVMSSLSFLSYTFTAVAYTRIVFALCFRLKLKQQKKFRTKEVSGCRNSKEYSGEVAYVEKVELASVISTVSTIQEDISNPDDCEKAKSPTVSDTNSKNSKGNTEATQSKGRNDGLLQEQKQVNRTTVIMFLITLIHFSSAVTVYVGNLLVGNHLYLPDGVHEVIGFTFRTLYMVIYITNPLCYMIMSSRFRERVRKLFCRLRE